MLKEGTEGVKWELGFVFHWENDIWVPGTGIWGTNCDAGNGIWTSVRLGDWDFGKNWDVNMGYIPGPC